VVRINDDPSRDCVGEPQAPTLVSGQPKSALGKRLYITAAYSPMCTYGDEREIAFLTIDEPIVLL
jgi:hypothetical protein